MPTPPSVTTTTITVGGPTAGQFSSWGALRTVLSGGQYPDHYTSTSGYGVEYPHGFYPSSKSLIRSAYTPHTFFSMPALAPFTSGSSYYLLATQNAIEDSIKPLILGSLATFHSGDTATVTSDAFAGYPGQLLSVTTDPEYVTSLSGWTSL